MIQKTNVVIVDDDALCVKHLKDSLGTFENISIAGIANTALLGKELIIEHRPSLVFLDIELPDMNGLDLLRELNSNVNWALQVVFYTAYDKYLLEALRNSAFDYILKPFGKDELARVMDRFFCYMQKDNAGKSFSNEMDRLFPTSTVIMVATIDGFRLLHLELIGYFWYLNDKKHWVALLSDLSEIHFRKSVKASDIVKYSNSFMQIGRDHIINVSYLSMVRGKECLLYPPFDKATGLTANSKFILQLQERFSLM